jgi:predicted  nucleic acid-binding Zn-ribbon protein
MSSPSSPIPTKTEQAKNEVEEVQAMEQTNNIPAASINQHIEAVPITDLQRKLEPTEEKQMWKLFKGKTVLMFRLCGSCQYKLFHSTEKWVRNNNGVDVKIHLCPRCVRVNCWMTNLMAPATPKKFVEKLEKE